MNPILSLAFVLLGAVAGSFAGVVSERINTGQSWKSGRSRCNACGRTLGFLDLVPVISWLLSLGRCRTCRARIAGTYALLEASLSLCFFLAYRSFGLSLPLAPFLAALFILAVIVAYDLRHMIVPPALSSAFIACALLFAWLSYAPAHAIVPAFLTACAITAFFLVMYFASRGRVMGLGDAPVSFALALLAGGQALAGLVFSFWIGAAIGIIVLFSRPKGHRMGIEVPFVPFLAAGFLLAIFTQWNPFPIALF